MLQALSKRWLVGGAVLAVIAVVIAGALLTAGDDDIPDASRDTTEATSRVVPGTSSASDPGVADTGTDADASDGMPIDVTPPDDGASPDASAPDDGATASGTDGVAPADPADNGSALATITIPPVQTVAMIDADRATPGSRYTVTFSVYGYGPPGGAGSLVIRVQSSTPIGDVEQPYDFVGRNVLARLTPASADLVKVGGLYSGTLTLQTSGTVLVPTLGDVRSGP
jgi:hypothetical protein